MLIFKCTKCQVSKVAFMFDIAAQRSKKEETLNEIDSQD